MSKCSEDGVTERAQSCLLLSNPRAFTFPLSAPPSRSPSALPLRAQEDVETASYRRSLEAQDDGSEDESPEAFLRRERLDVMRGVVRELEEVRGVEEACRTALGSRCRGAARALAGELHVACMLHAC